MKFLDNNLQKKIWLIFINRELSLNNKLWIKIKIEIFSNFSKNLIFITKLS